MPMVILMDDEYRIKIQVNHTEFQVFQAPMYVKHSDTFQKLCWKKIMLQVLTLFNFKLKLFKVEIYPCLALLGLSANQNIVQKFKFAKP